MTCSAEPSLEDGSTSKVCSGSARAHHPPPVCPIPAYGNNRPMRQCSDPPKSKQAHKRRNDNPLAKCFYLNDHDHLIGDKRAQPALNAVSLTTTGSPPPIKIKSLRFKPEIEHRIGCPQVQASFSESLRHRTPKSILSIRDQSISR